MEVTQEPRLALNVRQSSFLSLPSVGLPGTSHHIQPVKVCISFLKLCCVEMNVASQKSGLPPPPPPFLGTNFKPLYIFTYLFAVTKHQNNLKGGDRVCFSSGFQGVQSIMTRKGGRNSIAVGTCGSEIWLSRPASQQPFSFI